MNNFYSNLSEVLNYSQHCDSLFEAQTEACACPQSESLTLRGCSQTPECEYMCPSPIPPAHSKPCPDKCVADVDAQGLNGFLRSQLGRRVKAELELAGSVVQKSGYLVAVGRDYAVLYDPGTKDYFVCDFFSIKLITIFGEDEGVELTPEM